MDIIEILGEKETFTETNEKRIADEIVARVLVNLRKYDRRNKEQNNQIDQIAILFNVIDALKMISDGYNKTKGK